MRKAGKKRIVTIGGGTGQSAPLQGLVLLGGGKKFETTAIVGMADSGGSSGRLRDELGVLPPGDILKALLALSTRPYARDLLSYRFNGRRSSVFKGHTPGNFLLTMMSSYCGDYLNAVRAMEQLLDCQGRVFPASLDLTTLVGVTNRGRTIRSEGEIEQWIYNTVPVRGHLMGLELDPVPQLLPAASKAIREADLVVIGPGSFYTSLAAVLKVSGLSQSLRGAGRVVAYVVNLTTHPRETPGWTARRFVEKTEELIGRKVNMVLCNSSIPQPLREKYGEEKAEIVSVDIPSSWDGRQVVVANFVKQGATLARHDPKRLAVVIASL